MRVLWLCNIIIPQICEKLGIACDNVGSWMNQLADRIDQRREIQLGVVAPLPEKSPEKYVRWGEKSEFFGFSLPEGGITVYDESLKMVFQEIIEQFRPDVVNIFGTEYPHTLSMVQAFHAPERTVIHIQGLVSVYQKHYAAFLPERIVKRKTLKDWIRGDNSIRKQKEQMALDGKYEIAALKKVDHVMGRTDWDYIETKKINPDVSYHYVQEMMRKNFYCDAWDYQSCEKYSIFMSQGHYAIKGLHIMLRALKELVKKYPDIRLYVAGYTPYPNVSKFSFSERIRADSYWSYIMDLIKKWKLQEQVCFTGSLDAERMKERFLKANVFVSASVIENSPNSIGEAMLLGVPIVASDVGGVSSIMGHEPGGYLYPASQWKALAKYIDKVFMEEDQVCVGQCLRKRALAQYDPDVVEKDLLECYHELYAEDVPV